MAGQTAPCQAAEKVSRMSFRAQRGIPLRLKSQEKEGFLTPQTPFGMTDTDFFSSLLWPKPSDGGRITSNTTATRFCQPMVTCQSHLRTSSASQTGVHGDQASVGSGVERRPN